MIIFDELHKLKSWKAQQSKIALELSKHIKYKIGLTGTPIGNSLLDLFNEIRILDLGKSLGNSFWKYRSMFFDEMYGYFASDWIPKENAEENITNRLKNTIIRYSKEECLDLPDKVYETRTVQMSDLQGECLWQLQNDLDTYLEREKVEVNGVLPKYMKMSQATGGFIKHGDKDILFEKNPKLDELVDLVNEIDGKIVITHRFVVEGRMIEKALKKKKWEVRCLRGEITNKNQQLLDFQEDPEVKAIIINPQSGGIGIDLFQSSTMIFYSNSYSWLDRYQCEGRIHRTGQTQKCSYIDLIAEDSIDELLYDTLMGKKSLSDRILTNLKGK
jgi:SNF2 family DNA or RNA helicase